MSAGSAATGRSLSWLLPRVPGGRRPQRIEPAVRPVALEDLRQSAAQPRAGRARAAVARRLVSRAARLGLDTRRRRRWSPSRRCCMASSPCCASRRDVRMARHADRGSSRDRWRTGAVRIPDRLPPARGGRQPGRGPAHAVAHARHAPQAARVESVRSSGHGGDQQLGASFRTMWVAPLLAVAAAAVLAVIRRLRCRLRCRSCTLACRARHRLVAESPAAAPRGAPVARPGASSCARSRARPGHSSRPSSARKTTGCRPTISRKHPARVIAHRTSPTNIGLALLANLAAHDFGYISAGTLIERTAATFRTMAALVAVPRTFLQLVRHADPATAAAALRVVGRQRQSRRYLLTLRPGSAALPDQPIVDRALVRRPRGHVRRARRRGARARPRRRSTPIADARWRRTRNAHRTTLAAMLDAARGSRRDCADALAAGHDCGRLTSAAAGLGCRASSGSATRLRDELVLARDPRCDSGDPQSDDRARAQPAASRHCRTALRALPSRRPSAAARIAACDALAQRGDGIRRRWNSSSSTTGRATCWRSATTSTNAARHELLRPAGLRGPPRQLRRHRPGTAAAGKLVRARPPADDRGRRARAACRGAARCSST